MNLISVELFSSHVLSYIPPVPSYQDGESQWLWVWLIHTECESLSSSALSLS